jgi:hypothetical protein
MKTFSSTNLSNSTGHFLPGWVGYSGNEKAEGILSIYPNPAVNNLFVEYVLVSEPPYKIEILNSEGKLVFSKSLKSNTGIEKINLLHLPAGVYTIGFGNISSRTFVIAK